MPFKDVDRIIEELCYRISFLEKETINRNQLFVLGEVIKSAEKRLDRLENKIFTNVCKTCGQVIEKDK